MKTIIPLITLTATLSLLAATVLRGQTLPSPEAQAAIAIEQAQAAREHVTQQLEKAQLQLDQTRTQMAQAVAGGGSGGGMGAPLTPGFRDRLQTIIRHAPGPGKTLVIRSADADPKEQAALEEDLAVMSRVLDRAIAEKLGGQQMTRTAMGIDLVFAPGANPIRSLYLDGYGALFMVNVGFPLLPPPATAEAQKEKAPADSTWEEARRELYGQPANGKIDSSLVEDYDADKVNKLKDALVEALKNASNIRNLKPDDSITVCVFGGASVSSFKVKSPKATGPGAGSEISFQADEANLNLGSRTLDVSDAKSRGTILTIRAKKPDVDAFAGGKLNADGFRKKISSATYQGGGGGGGGFAFGGNGTGFFNGSH